MSSLVSVGPWIAQRRNALGLTQRELASQVACSVETIRKIEAGRRRPSRQIAELLAAKLAVPSEQRSAFVQCARAGQIDSALLSGSLQPLPSYPNHNLPDPPTPLIGREDAIADAVRH